ncbi:hypothetical protein MNEG_15371, partial [Monoraphidium neglectum]
VVDAMAEHFTRFADDERAMPVVWHQTLLCFVQRYKSEVRAADRDALRRLCAAQQHYQVTPEVLRELDHSAPREQRRAERQRQEEAAAAAVGKHVQEDVRNLPPVPMLDD